MRSSNIDVAKRAAFTNVIKGKPVKIVTVRGGNITIDEGAIKSVIDKANPKYPICVLSTVGCFRHGKSALLNFFLRYLSSSNENGNQRTPDGEKPAWINVNDSIKNGFTVAGGDEGVTNGIDLWSEVFTINNKHGTVNVILMDTQGLFDNNHGSNTDKCIFGMTTMLSSYQIFNFVRNFNTLLYDYCSGMISFVQQYQNLNHEKPFQHYEFLCRDYSNFADPQNISTCVQQGQDYLRSYCSRSAPRIRESQNKVNDMYKEVTSFCLPHPGDQVACLNFDGTISRFNEPFRKLVGFYVEEVMANICPLKVGNQELSTNDCFTYFSKICKAFSEPSKFPSPNDLISIQDVLKIHKIAETIAITAKRRLWDSFYPGRRYVEPAYLNDVYQKAKQEAEKQFSQEFPNRSELTEIERKAMMKVIDEYYSMVSNSNHGIKPYESYGGRRYGAFGPRSRETIYPDLKYVPSRP